jgi:hypothetical protein
MIRIPFDPEEITVLISIIDVAETVANKYFHGELQLKYLAGIKSLRDKLTPYDECTHKYTRDEISDVITRYGIDGAAKHYGIEPKTIRNIATAWDIRFTDI